MAQVAPLSPEPTVSVSDDLPLQAGGGSGLCFLPALLALPLLAAQGPTAWALLLAGAIVVIALVVAGFRELRR